ncbi:hypothetical protein TrVE_jg10007 [Triparma verrucosa]|uniref:Smr domain-containing protein n=1 Tax=Triparma verrucosa TaxID=1606542 RepID=A0A9W7FMC1_9STRA|nr:hypothetical protein TrVE_jg10007 [Triparma verrucosa]
MSLNSASITERSRRCLEYSSIMRDVASHATTKIGESLLLSSTADTTSKSLQDVHTRYSQLSEMLSILTLTSTSSSSSDSDVSASLFPPTPNDLSLLSLLSSLRKTSAILDFDEFRIVTDALSYMNHIQTFFSTRENQEKFPALFKLSGQYIFVTPELLENLEKAFDPQTGQLSLSAYPTLAQLKSSIATKKSQIQSTLNSIVSQLDPSSLPSDNTPSLNIINNRYTIAVNPSSMRSVGILHSRSRTEKTCYVEPFALIEPTNDLIEYEQELDREERKILRQLTNDVMKNYESIATSLNACGELDSVRAKAVYAEETNSNIPDVQAEGIIRINQGRHPSVSSCVPNDVSLGDDDNQGLILSGPNSGGKTVILKLLGTYALMIKDGLALPTSPGSRCDFFTNILADIGDSQSLSSELSTFSAHMNTMRDVLTACTANPASSLVVLDEIGSGTAPDQGVALGQSIIEELIGLDVRVVLTTHFLELKQLASSDPRFRIAGMQFLSNKPTYKLEMGSVGESFALAVAEKMGLPPKILERANSLLSEETRTLSDLVRSLEEEKAAATALRTDLSTSLEETTKLKSSLATQQAQLETIKTSVRKSEARKFAKTLEEKEAVLENLLIEMQEKSASNQNSVKVVGKTWDNLKLLKRDVINSASPNNNNNNNPEATSGSPPLSASDKITVGQSLLVTKQASPFYGKLGTVIGLSGVKNVELSIGSLSSRFKRNELSLPDASADTNVSGSASSSSPKISKRVLAEEEAERSSQRTQTRKKKGGKMMRMDGNTVDCLGMDAEDALLNIRGFFSRMVGSGRNCVYVLHGHGSGGVLKNKIRAALRKEALVEKFSPADDEDGGDAFTMVFLKDSLL